MIESRMPMSRALLWILVSTLLISGSAFMGWLYFLHVRERRLHDDQYRIVAIIQSTPQADSLKSVYLAELLDLSLDRPVNLYQFNAQDAVKTLLKHPLIKSASIKKNLPGSLYIDYCIRTPIAYIGDFANTVIDEEGYLFPFHPFFNPKLLPTLYLGLEKEKWKEGDCLKDHAFLTLAFTLLQQLNPILKDHLFVKKLDVTQAQSDSYGQRQIVLTLEEIDQKEEKFSSLIYVRLNSDPTAQDLINFYTLYSSLFEKKNSSFKEILLRADTSMMIDLRIPHLAFIKPVQAIK